MKKILMATVFMGLIGVWSCKKKDPTPTPTTTTSTTGTTTVADKIPLACCTASPSKNIEVNTAINFLDCSQDGFSFQYDFGDSTPVSTEHQPTHAYTKPGNYTITQTVYSQTKKYAEKSTVKIVVGERYATKLEITSLDWIDPFTKKKWDAAEAGTDSTGPDVYIFVNNNVTTAPVFSNEADKMKDITPATISSLVWDLKANAKSFKLTGAVLDFHLVDDDAGSPTDMEVFAKVNPVAYGSSPIMLTKGKYIIKIYYEIK